MSDLTWYHRTCAHRAPRIMADGVLNPYAQPVLQHLPLVWVTTSMSATRVQLGLTAKSLDCDRWEFLFRVVPEDVEYVFRWGDVKAGEGFEPFLPGARRLDAVRGTRPGLWGVATRPLRVEPMFVLN